MTISSLPPSQDHLNLLLNYINKRLNSPMEHIKVDHKPPFMDRYVVLINKTYIIPIEYPKDSDRDVLSTVMDALYEEYPELFV